MADSSSSTDKPQTLTLVAPDDVATGSIITVTAPDGSGVSYKVKGDHTVDGVDPEHFAATLKGMGYKKQPAAPSAAATPPATEPAKG